MAWAWSPYFCQHLLENLAAQSGLHQPLRLSDSTPHGEVDGLLPSHAEYLDNVVLAGYHADM
eukprot:867887-Karenia_brevis.AAC.1